jgi:hypothetical protein
LGKIWQGLFFIEESFGRIDITEPPASEINLDWSFSTTRSVSACKPCWVEGQTQNAERINRIWGEDTVWKSRYDRVSTSLKTGDNVGVLVDEELLIVEFHLLTSVLGE